MKSLLILGTGTDQIEGILEAKKMGLHTVGLDGNAESDGATLVDEFYKVNIKNLNEVLGFVKNYPKPINGVIAFGVDIPEILAKVAEERNLYYQITYEKARVSKNKYLSKQLMAQHGVNVPPYRGVSSLSELRDFIAKFGLPVVLKPIDNSASRGVLRLTEKTDLKWAFNESLKHVNDKSFSPNLIVEKFIEGQQLSTESIISRGKLYTIGLSERNYELLEKYAPLIIENGGDLPPELLYFENYNELIEKLDEQLQRIVDAFASGDGTVKGDIVIDEEGKIWVIEAAFRLSGGLLSTLEIPLNTGINFIRRAIEIQLSGKYSGNHLAYRSVNLVRVRYMFAEKQKGTIKRIATPNLSNVIFKVYGKEGMEVETLFELSKLPLAKLIGYVVWDKSITGLDRREREVIQKTEILIENSLKPLS